MSFYTTLSTHYAFIFPLSASHKALFNHVLTSSFKTGLDIGCATGLITEYMYKRGISMIGFDLSETMIDIAKEKENKQLQFLVGDMTQLNNLFPVQTFDVITCLGNTLVHVKQDDVNNIINHVASLLNKNGMFVIQIVNYDRILKYKPSSLPLIKNDDIVFNRTYEYPSSHDDLILFKAQIQDLHNDLTYSDETYLYPLRYFELKELLVKDFEIIEKYGSWSMDPYDEDLSPSLIIVAQKK